MKILKSGPFRAIAYIIIFAGLLKLVATLFAFIWNHTLVTSFDLPAINVLESVGVLAFVYLILTSIRFGFQAFSNQFFPSNNPSKCTNCDYAKSTGFNQKIQMLSKDEKDQLKQAIAKCCGIPQNQNIQKIKH